MYNNFRFFLSYFVARMRELCGAVCHRFARQNRNEKRSFRLRNSAPFELLFSEFLKYP